jgi:hypothetical protein
MLWSAEEVKRWFLALIASREGFDSKAGSTPCTPAERAWKIAACMEASPKRVLSFRQIYRTWWDAALAREGTTPQVVADFCKLVTELSESTRS